MSDFKNVVAAGLVHKSGTAAEIAVSTALYVALRETRRALDRPGNSGLKRLRGFKTALPYVLQLSEDKTCIAWRNRHYWPLNDTYASEAPSRLVPRPETTTVFAEASDYGYPCLAPDQRAQLAGDGNLYFFDDASAPWGSRSGLQRYHDLMVSVLERFVSHNLLMASVAAREMAELLTGVDPDQAPRH